MVPLKLSEESAIALYPTAPAEWKETLIQTFGKEMFNKNVLERVFNIEDACREKGITTKKLFEGIDDPYDQAEIAIKIFAEVLREGKHESECFYYPYFDLSGGGFSYFVSSYGGTGTGVGARLRVDTPSKAAHLGKCMESYYKIYLTGK